MPSVSFERRKGLPTFNVREDKRRSDKRVRLGKNIPPFFGSTERARPNASTRLRLGVEALYKGTYGQPGVGLRCLNLARPRAAVLSSLLQRTHQLRRYVAGLTSRGQQDRVCAFSGRQIVVGHSGILPREPSRNQNPRRRRKHRRGFEDGWSEAAAGPVSPQGPTINIKTR